MKSKLYFLVCLILVILPGCASTQQVKPVSTGNDYALLERIIDFHVDNLQNIYILNMENKVVRYSEKMQKQYDYSNNLIGEIKSIDATNPQKILCFVKDFNRIVVLDNTLAEINIIDLSTSDYLDVSAVSRSNDNQIWLFDPINQVLVKVNDLVEKQVESNRITDLNLGVLEPVFIQERNNIVALTDPNVGILIFDNFGQFIKLVPEKGVEEFQVFGDYLFFVQEGKYYQYHIKRYEKAEIPAMEVGYDQFRITKKKTYYVDENGLVIVEN